MFAMKITLNKLKQVVVEEIQRLNEATEEDPDKFTIYGTREELDKRISSMDPFTVAEDDYVDSDTGEVYLARGEPAMSSSLHPQHQDQSGSRGMNSWSEDDQMDFDAENAEAAITYDSVNAHDDLVALINDFADGHHGLDKELNVAPEHAAPEHADSFFLLRPEWRELAMQANLSKRAVREIVIDSVYNALMS